MGKSNVCKHGNGYRIRWTDESGTRRSATYSSKKEAELELLKLKLEVHNIKRGGQHRFLEKQTFDDLAAYWLKEVAPNKRSFKDQVSIINLHLKPHFSGLRLSEINQSHVQKFTNHKSALSQKTIINHLTVLISMLNLAVDMRWLREAPRLKKPKLIRDSTYAYLKTDEEVNRFLEASKYFGLNVFSLNATALFTGLRAGELAGLRWVDINFETRRICVQRSFDKPTKSGEIRYVPILDSLMKVLVEWRSHGVVCEYVFPSQAGTMLLESGRIFQETFKRVLDRGEFPKRMIGGKEKYYITFHDLRHTFASHWMMKGGDIYRLQSILGHQSIEMTQRYAHLSPHIYKEDYGRLNSLGL